MLEELLRDAAILILLGGFSLAAYLDWTTREVTDRLWQIMAGAGVVLGGVAAASYGPGGFALWALISAFVIEHLVPWDAAVAHISESLPDYIEVAAYVLVGAILAIAGVLGGIGPTGLPAPVLAVYVSVLIGRALFEAGILYGGADAKAFITASVLVPIQASTLAALPDGAGLILSYYPFALTLLTDAALVAIVVPIAIAIRNLRRREFTFPNGFTRYRIPISELPERFVWVKDPALPSAADQDAEIETSDDDRRLRERQRAELEARSITTVWVTPQLPFLVLMAGGALFAVVAGNLLIDLLYWL